MSGPSSATVGCHEQQQQNGSPQEAMSMQSAATAGPDAHQHSPPIDIPMSHGPNSPPEEAAELDEFSSFNYWRSPPAMLVDDTELTANSADTDSNGADSNGADSGESPAHSPEGAEQPLGRAVTE